MATLSSPSPPSSPSLTMRRKGFVRRVERYCWNVFTYFPLAFVYGLTSWAVWVAAGIGFEPVRRAWTGKGTSVLSVVLYLLLNWSYTTAVFTDPGSPLNLNLNHGYSHLPTQDTIAYTSYTVKSTGDIRYCKKCQSKKPDRAHHCSTCGRCVLKMDHHCPWLATCVGLRNYKHFVLFLVYLSFFCWVCFTTSASWVWSEILSESQYTETLMPVNTVLLAVISGIIGLVITGFTMWHLYLAMKGQTTIESLEKTRYLSPLRRQMRQQLNNRNYIDPDANGRPSISDQLREIHANSLPGITRPEEGESSPNRSLSRSPSPNPSSMSNDYSHGGYANSHSYEHRERQRDIERYDAYLEEKDSDSLPSAFDLGWRRNLKHVFGPSPLLWFFPITNTTGDGWSWEPSPKWLVAREQIRKERETQARIQKERERAAGWGVDSPTEAEMMRNGDGPYAAGNNFSPPTRPSRRPEWQSPRANKDEHENRYLTTSNGVAMVPMSGRRSPGKADQILGRERGMYADGDMQLQTLDRDRRKADQYGYVEEEDGYEVSSDEERAQSAKRGQSSKSQKNWNDIPEDFLKPPPKGKRGSRSSSKQRKTEEWDEWGGES
ncbi:zf-DHHC-domain-containing protein [Mytilinidion resinicola]|uniref:Palmitoyltransferase n=1 Tax=Mytilinidion resinicola TaxID=574789 RepID=A0A6A6Z7U5_9PEZI|nr:zf-DHHC-domain-containing protein [Mytilinidion resinicola]KAF2817181.1 zf-DHHC-domain-containing protein [Mytilinidion resinicola]